MRMVRRQVEFYFSDKNLFRDEALRTEISQTEGGWIDSEWLLMSPRLASAGIQQADLEQALASSEAVDVEMSAESDEASSRRLRVRRSGGKALPRALPGPPGRPGGYLLVVDCSGLRKWWRRQAVKAFPEQSRSFPQSSDEELLGCSESDEESEEEQDGAEDLKELVKSAVASLGVSRGLVHAVSEVNSFCEVVVALLPFPGDAAIFEPLQQLKVLGKLVPAKAVFGSARAKALRALPSRARQGRAERWLGIGSRGRPCGRAPGKNCP